ncbi:MAG: dTDP-4-dehydrorhamnose 3,5-epimerase family protein, partial [Betaproteobacteria bacterium]|nr:dTDP-4-dehydrorhamnose 3,5-epimerase family protein [Betaproteobacteria bacterium]
DERGYFSRVWCQDELSRQGLNAGLSQVNTALSALQGTLRGMHFQVAPHAEVKIARCLRGAAFDVVLDLRPDSPAFRRWFGLLLTPQSGEMLYIPEGCAHGYLTMADDTELLYFSSVPYAPAAARGVCHDDPAFGIRWPADVRVISQADRSWPAFATN